VRRRRRRFRGRRLIVRRGGGAERRGPCRCRGLWLRCSVGGGRCGPRDDTAIRCDQAEDYEAQGHQQEQRNPSVSHEDEDPLPNAIRQAGGDVLPHGRADRAALKQRRKSSGGRSRESSVAGMGRRIRGRDGVRLRRLAGWRRRVIAIDERNRTRQREGAFSGAKDSSRSSASTTRCPTPNDMGDHSRFMSFARSFALGRSLSTKPRVEWDRGPCKAMSDPTAPCGSGRWGEKMARRVQGILDSGSARIHISREAHGSTRAPVVARIRRWPGTKRAGGSSRARPR